MALLMMHARVSYETLLQVCGVTYMLVRQSSYLVVIWVYVQNLWWPQIWQDEFCCFLLQHINWLTTVVHR